MRNAIVLILPTLLLLWACGQESSEAPADIASAIGETHEFEWVSEGNEAGHSKMVRTGDGKVTVESFLHWNNREYSVNSELQLNADGIPVAQKITGTSPFGATIDETFTYTDGVASWSTAGESGSVTTDDPGFYVATEYADLSFGALVQAALRSMDGEIALLPSGTARAEKLTTVEVDTPDGEKTLTLVAVSGLGLTPYYGWFDENLKVAALDFGGWMGMLSEGLESEVLDQLSTIQIAAGCDDDGAHRG